MIQQDKFNLPKPRGLEILILLYADGAVLIIVSYWTLKINTVLLKPISGEWSDSVAKLKILVFTKQEKRLQLQLKN